MPPLRISLLGAFRITGNEAAITPIESERGRALLAYLAVESGKPHRREMLATLLWPEASQGRASQNIRRAIYNLRKALESDSEGLVLLVSRGEVQFNNAAGHQVDAVMVSGLLAATATHTHNPNPNNPNSASDPNSLHNTDNSIEACGWCIEQLKEAAELYSGDFLASLSFIGGEQFEVWRTQKQEDLHIRMMAALTHIASYHKRRREYADASRYLRQQLTLEPWREEAHYQLIEALARSGQTAEALHQYEACRRILEDELNIEPSPATTALYRRIRAADPEFSPTKPLNYGVHNLPAQPTALIGREKELADITALFGREDVRLVTLKGPGGTGKTRLALQLGMQLGTSLSDSFQDGVWLVELATIVEPKLVVPTIADTLGVKEARGTPLIDTLRSYLKSKRLLLILDNLEQVMAAAIDISRLLSSGPGVKVLCTSRVPLRIRGEREYGVRPLALPNMKQLPSADALTQYAAVQLFAARATDVKPDFELTNDNAPAVAEICVRLDGLPLAIELAATRVRLFSPQVLLARLSKRLKVLTGGARDLPVRHQTMRRAIAWSYDLLEEEEKLLFRRLAVFQGWRTIEAVEAVCSYEGKPDNESNTEAQLELDIPNGVQSLLDKSLLQRRGGSDGRPRLWMLETLHEYAQEKLEESGEFQGLKWEHAQYFMRLAEEAEPELTGKQQTEWLVRLEYEHDNIRAALRWVMENGTTEAIEIGLRMVGALWRFWNVRGHFTEGREQIMAVLARASALSQPAMRVHKAKALNGAGVLAWTLGDYDAAHTLHEESLALRRELGDKLGIAYTLTNLGIVAWSQGDYAAARGLYEESLALKRELGDKLGISYSLNNLGTVTREQGDYATARTLYEESLALRRELGDKLGIAYTLTNLGTVAYSQGDYSYALTLHEESLTLKRELGHKLGIAYTLNNLGNVAKEQRNLAAARSLYEESLSLQRELGDKLGIAYSLNNLGILAYLQGDYAEALVLYEESLALRRELGDKMGTAASLNNLANVAYAQEHHATARTFYEESLALRRELVDPLGSAISLAGLGRLAVSLGGVKQGTTVLAAVARVLEDLGVVLDSEDRIPYERAVDLAREHLGKEEFEGAWQQGLAMSIEQAILYSSEQLVAR
jgi:predicted ATPase/DNA-binding SARP family transcriptional activator/Tfp pilus assembly protein PilF